MFNFIYIVIVITAINAIQTTKKINFGNNKATLEDLLPYCLRTC